MSESRPRLEGHARGRFLPVFVAILGLCTLWLVAQNLVLFALAPWHHLPVRLLPGALVAPLVGIGVALLGLVPIAFAAGWMIAGCSRRSREGRSS